MAGSRLGRGLDSLLSSHRSAIAQREQNFENENSSMVGEIAYDNISSNIDSKNQIKLIFINDLIPSVYQPRKNFNEDNLEELSLSIQEHGLLEPLVVKRSETVGKYEIICGERRFRAAKLAALDRLPCVITDVADKNAYAIALIENIQREDLNPIEEANALNLMINECNLTQEDLAKTLGKPRATIANYLRLNNLNDEVKKLVSSKEISMGHAKVLLALDNDIQIKVANVVVDKGLSVRQTENYIKALKSEDPKKSEVESRQPALFNKFSEILNNKLKGAKVKFVSQGDGKGKVTFSFKNNEELTRVLQFLGITDVSDLNDKE